MEPDQTPLNSSGVRYFEQLMREAEPYAVPDTGYGRACTGWMRRYFTALADEIGQHDTLSRTDFAETCEQALLRARKERFAFDGAPEGMIDDAAMKAQGKLVDSPFYKYLVKHAKDVCVPGENGPVYYPILYAQRRESLIASFRSDNLKEEKPLTEEEILDAVHDVDMGTFDVMFLVLEINAGQYYDELMKEQLTPATPAPAAPLPAHAPKKDSWASQVLLTRKGLQPVIQALEAAYRSPTSKTDYENNLLESYNTTLETFVGYLNSREAMNDLKLHNLPELGRRTCTRNLFNVEDVNEVPYLRTELVENVSRTSYLPFIAKNCQGPDGEFDHIIYYREKIRLDDEYRKECEKSHPGEGIERADWEIQQFEYFQHMSAVDEACEKANEIFVKHAEEMGRFGQGI